MVCQANDHNEDYFIAKSEACSIMLFLESELMPWPCSLAPFVPVNPPKVGSVSVKDCINACDIYDNNKDKILTIVECCQVKQYFIKYLFAYV